MNLKDRPGWPKKYRRVNEDGSCEEITDFGYKQVSRNVDAPKEGIAEKVEKWSKSKTNLPSVLKPVLDKLRELLESGEYHPDQKPQIERLISDINTAVHMYQTGYKGDAAVSAFHIGVNWAVLVSDCNLRETIQAKRDTEEAARKPRKLTPAWGAVRNAYVSGMKPMDAFKIYRKAGGNADPENFRKEFRLKFKKSGG